jgi:hypothetical protein
MSKDEYFDVLREQGLLPAMSPVGPLDPGKKSRKR